MNKSQTIADFILKEGMKSFAPPVVEQAFKSFNPGLAPLISIRDVHNAFQKIKRGYRTKESEPTPRRIRRNPLVKGDYIDFAVYVAAAGDRLNQSEKSKALKLIADKWELGKN
jgi:hypothetical protein